MLLNNAQELGKLLDEHRGADVVVMDMRLLNFWTDFFVIATVTSNAHLTGLERHVKDYAQEVGLEILRCSRKSENDDEWRLLDLGGIVIHLMTAKSRSFFELERLWSAAPLVYGEHSGTREALIHEAGHRAAGS
jgi:ribosome-associated protein